MKRHAKPLKFNSDINITNLLDVCFVLLICFMLIAPTLKHGIELDLPDVSSGAINPSETKKNCTIVIRKKRANIDEASLIYLDDKVVTIEELQSKLKSMAIRDPKMDVFIECDKTAVFDTFAAVLGAVKAAELNNIGIVTEPESNKEEKK